MASDTSIKRKAVSGMVWTSIQRFTGMGINFVSGIILARLLMPEDYGAIGMLTIFMLIAHSFLDSGFGSALIQKKRPTQEDYSTVFWFNLMMAIVLYLILFFSAPFIAEFYRMPILCEVLRIQALVLIISAITIVQVNQLRKQFKFKKIAIVSLVASLLSLAVTIWMANNGYGVWSLVVQGLLLSGIPSIIYWFTNKWYPNFIFSKESFKSLFSFGAYMLLIHLINEICNNIQGLLIGRLYNASTMGYYSKARSTENFASKSISQSLTQITFPLYAEFQDNKEGLIALIKRFTGVVAYVTFPLMFLLILVAKPVFILLYSDRWLPSVPYFQVLCFAGLAICLQSINLQAITAIGKSKTAFGWTLIKRAIGLIFVIGGLLLFGIKGLLVGMVLSSWMMYLINAYLVSKHIGYKIGQQMMDLLPIMLLSILAFVIGRLPDLLALGLYQNGILETILFVAIYLAVSYMSKMRSYEDLIELMPMIIGKLRKKEEIKELKEN